MKSAFYIILVLGLMSCGVSRPLPKPVPVTAVAIGTLNGSGSYDLDGHIISYGWKQISGGTKAVIKNPSAVITPVTFTKKGVYQFELMVTDNNGATDKDSTMIKY